MKKKSMTKDEIFIKNNILGAEFDRYLIEHPEFAEKIPEGVRIVLLPKNDPELCEVNKEIAKKHSKKDGLLIMYVVLKDLAPQKSRLIDPQLLSEAV